MLINIIIGILTGLISGKIVEYFHNIKNNSQRKKILSVLMAEINSENNKMFRYPKDYTEVDVIINSDKLESFINSINRSITLLITYVSYEELKLLLEIMEKGENLIILKNRVKNFYNEGIFRIILRMLIDLNNTYINEEAKNYPIAHYIGMNLKNIIEKSHINSISEIEKINIADEFVVNYYFNIKYINSFNEKFKYIKNNSKNFSFKFEKNGKIKSYGI